MNASSPHFSQQNGRMRYTLQVCAALLGTGLLASAGAPVAQAQGGPRIQIPTQLLTKVPTVRPFLVPELRSHLLATKLKVSPAVLDSAYVLRDGIPAFKLADGSVRLLMPPTGAEAATQAAAPAPDELQESAPYYSLMPKLGTFNSEIIKVNPGLLIAKGVDNRSKMTPIKDQSSRGTCVAFASNAALEAFPSIDNDLSEQYSYHMYLQNDGQEFCFNKGTYTATALNILKNNGTVVESVMPYTGSIPACDESLPTAAGDAKKYKITKATLITNAGLTGVSIKNTNYLESVLNKGYNIVIGTQVAWYGSHKNDVIDVVIDSVTNEPAASRGNHEMVIVGYDRPGQYFIVRNSWGTGFGHDGYAYLSYDYIRTYTFDGFYIQGVSPVALNMVNPDSVFKPINPNIIRIPR